MQAMQAQVTLKKKKQMIDIMWTNQVPPGPMIAPRARDDFSELYHTALMDFERVTRPESQPSSHADAQEAYNAHCYNLDIPCCWIRPKVPQESMCPITLQGPQPPISHVMLQAMQTLVSIPICWLITSHFLEPFCSYLY